MTLNIRVLRKAFPSGLPDFRSAVACHRFAFPGACPRLPLPGRGKPLSYKAAASRRTPKASPILQYPVEK